MRLFPTPAPPSPCPCSFLDEPLPVDGYVTLSDKPGFGVTLNRKDNNLVRPYTQ